MISSTSSSDAVPRPDLTADPGAASARRPVQRPDRISTQAAAHLRAALAAEPEVRAEIVRHARALAADPSYPPPAVIEQIAWQIVQAPDLSEDEA